MCPNDRSLSIILDLNKFSDIFCGINRVRDQTTLLEIDRDDLLGGDLKFNVIEIIVFEIETLLGPVD